MQRKLRTFYGFGRKLKPLQRMTVSKVSGTKFYNAFQKALAAPGGESLTGYTTSEFSGMRTYLAYGGKVGGAIKVSPDGYKDAVSLFNQGGPRGAGVQMLDILRRHGANRLDCFAWLRPVYEKAGWRVTDTLKWDDKYAPTNWNYEKFGRPDIYIMEPV